MALTVISTFSAYLSYHASKKVSDASRDRTVQAARDARDRAQQSAIDACHQRATGRADIFNALSTLVQAVIPPPQNARDLTRDKLFIASVSPSINKYAQDITCVLPVGKLVLSVPVGPGIHIPSTPAIR